MLDKKRFPSGFRWGGTTSAYQIEGAWDVDGRQESIWDVFAQQPDAILDNSDGDTAIDHYHRFEADIHVMQTLGLQRYQFSISWPRIMPRGRGSINEAGIAFYDRLVDTLLDASIEPAVTLYHWDLPRGLQLEGGWKNRDIVYAFEAYTDAITSRIGDRVKFWTTLYDPYSSAFRGHESGIHAPGIQDTNTAILAAHHLMVAHGLAVRKIKQNVFDAQVGIALTFEPCYAASLSAADYHLARIEDGYRHRWFLDPLYGRRYPRDVSDAYIARGTIEDLSFVMDGDYGIIAAKTDYLGLNYFTRKIIRDEEAASKGTQTIFAREKADNGAEVFPHGLYDLVNRLHFGYHPNVMFIIGNGACFNTGPNAGGSIVDTRRIRFYQGHLTALHRAMANGVPIGGFSIANLLDSFAWERGYLERHGIVWVDFESQARTIKDSGHWYSKVIAENAIV